MSGVRLFLRPEDYRRLGAPFFSSFSSVSIGFGRARWWRRVVRGAPRARAPRTRPAVGAGIDGGFLVATGFALLFLFRSSLCPRQRAMTPRLFGGEDRLGETHSFPSLLFPRRPCPICNGSLPTCPLPLPDAPPGSPPFLFPSTHGEYEWMARVRSPYQTWRRRQNGCIPGDVPRSAGSATKWTFLIPSLRCAPPKCMTPLHGLENKKKKQAQERRRRRAVPFGSWAIGVWSSRTRLSEKFKMRIDQYATQSRPRTGMFKREKSRSVAATAP